VNLRTLRLTRSEHGLYDAFREDVEKFTAEIHCTEQVRTAERSMSQPRHDPGTSNTHISSEPDIRAGKDANILRATYRTCHVLSVTLSHFKCFSRGVERSGMPRESSEGGDVNTLWLRTFRKAANRATDAYVAVALFR
jgi:hypothetical protein